MTKYKRFRFKLPRDAYAEEYEMNLSIINDDCVQMKCGQV